MDDIAEFTENSPSDSMQDQTENVTDLASSEYSNIETASTFSSVGNSRNSYVWSHFTKDINYKTNHTAICKYCPKRYICNRGSTSSLNSHLKKYHSNKLNLSYLIATSNTLPDILAGAKVNKYLLPAAN